MATSMDPETCNYDGHTRTRCRRIVSNEDSGMCILHDPDPGKNIADFNAGLADQINHHDPIVELSGVVFPSGYECATTDFPSYVNLSRAQFLGVADFTKRRFLGGIGASGAEFVGAAHFSG